jgi:hypothetical protein
MDNRNKISTAGKVLNQIKNHKFWTSVIILLIITLAVRFFGPSISIGSWHPSYLFFTAVLYYYTLIGGIIWSVQAKKDGLSLITLGIYAAVISIISWLSCFSYGEFEIVSFISSIISPVASILLFISGYKRYKRWQQSQVGQEI